MSARVGRVVGLARDLLAGNEHAAAAGLGAGP
jgi:hypothetical protein